MMRNTAREFGRYLLWQVPGWILTAVIAWAVARVLDISDWLVVLVTGLVVAKDLALYPVLRLAFRPPADPRPIGARGRVVDALVPTGQVHVRGEFWQATTRDGSRVATGATVRVVEARGLLLVVEVDDAAPR